MNNMEKTDLDLKEKIAAKYNKWVLNYVSYVFFVDPVSKPGKRVYSSAGVTFIDTGERRFAVTNERIIAEYIRIYDTDKRVKFHLGPFIIDIENRIIDTNSNYDLATFEVKAYEVDRLNSQFCYVRPWAPKRIEKGEYVVFAGYPGILHKKIKSNSVSLDSAVFTEEIQSVDENGFKFSLNDPNYENYLSYRKSSEFTELGGFSGAGVFCINQNNSILFLEPVGIIYKGINDWQTQKVRHIDFINEYGEIDYAGN
jgi:hypothetical protein